MVNYLIEKHIKKPDVTVFVFWFLMCRSTVGQRQDMWRNSREGTTLSITTTGKGSVMTRKFTKWKSMLTSLCSLNYSHYLLRAISFHILWMFVILQNNSKCRLHWNVLKHKSYETWHLFAFCSLLQHNYRGIKVVLSWSCSSCSFSCGRKPQCTGGNSPIWNHPRD